MSDPDISVVICTYNRAEGLRDAIASLGRLATGGKFNLELLIVDNASQDHTREVIAQAARECPVPVRGVHEPVQGIVPARNRGIAEARGRWIAFFDDDQLAEPDWLLELHKFATTRNVRCVGGAVKLKLPTGCQRALAPYCRMLLGESLWSTRPMPYTPRVSPGAGNLMLEAALFREVGRFQRSIRGRGEDTDLFHRLLAAGIESWYVPTAIVHHVIPPGRLEEEFFLKHARRMGEDIAQVDVAERSWLHCACRGSIWAARGAGWCGAQRLMAWIGRQPERALELRAKSAMTSGYVSVLLKSLAVSRRPSAPPPASATAAPAGISNA